jgi:hypothetical protein
MADVEVVVVVVNTNLSLTKIASVLKKTHATSCYQARQGTFSLLLAWMSLSIMRIQIQLHCLQENSKTLSSIYSTMLSSKNASLDLKLQLVTSVFVHCVQAMICRSDRASQEVGLLTGLMSSIRLMTPSILTLTESSSVLRFLACWKSRLSDFRESKKQMLEELALLHPMTQIQVYQKPDLLKIHCGVSQLNLNSGARTARTGGRQILTTTGKR